jgi:hypothetical protein
MYSYHIVTILSHLHDGKSDGPGFYFSIKICWQNIEPLQFNGIKKYFLWDAI